MQVRRAVGVVDHDMQVIPLRRPDNRRDIHQLHVGVGRCLEVDHPCFAVDRRLQCLDIVQVDMADLHPEFANTVMQEGEGAAIQGAPDDHFVAGP
ncbi:hypothetical protein D3C85_1706460 [compost metagenome]